MTITWQEVAILISLLYSLLVASTVEIPRIFLARLTYRFLPYAISLALASILIQGMQHGKYDAYGV